MTSPGCATTRETLLMTAGKEIKTCLAHSHVQQVIYFKLTCIYLSTVIMHTIFGNAVKEIIKEERLDGENQTLDKRKSGYCKSTKFRDRFNFANFAVAYQLNRII